MSVWFDGAYDPAKSAQLHSLFSAHERQFSAGTVIKHEADECHSMYIVKKGWLALTKSLPEGQTQIIDFGLPGDIFDLTSADGRTSALTLETVTKAKVAAIPYEDWGLISNKFPSVSASMHRSMAAIRSRVSERMLRLGRGSAEERLAYAFLELGLRAGNLRDGSLDCFQLPLTQKQLGDFMGLTSVHVCRTLQTLEKRGLISVSGRICVCILKPIELASLAGISIEGLGDEILPAP